MSTGWADDYLARRLGAGELLALMDARLGPWSGAAVPTPAFNYRFGRVEVDFRRTEVRRDGILLGLSAKEYRLLCYFIQNRGATLSRDELLARVWYYRGQAVSRTVDTHVAWLRGKVEPNRRRPEFILTIHGLGYKFVG